MSVKANSVNQSDNQIINSFYTNGIPWKNWVLWKICFTNNSIIYIYIYNCFGFWCYINIILNNNSWYIYIHMILCNVKLWCISEHEIYRLLMKMFEWSLYFNRALSVLGANKPNQISILWAVIIIIMHVRNLYINCV